jgi:hypothetical protein
VTIVEDQDALGHCLGTPFAKNFDPDRAYCDARIRRLLEDQIMILCGGMAAQARVDDDESRVLLDGSSDMEKAIELATYATGNENEAEAWVEWLRLRTQRAVSNKVWWAGIQSLATALLQRQTMSGREAGLAIQAGLDTALRRR